MTRLRWATAGLILLSAGTATSGEVPGDSVYQLEMQLTTQDGQPETLAVDRGQPVLISMFYASCPHTCPILIASIQQMERRLPASSRNRLRVLMISIDPARDTQENLQALAVRHHADLRRWTFARAADADVRKLAAVLGVRYRALPNGEFNHSTVVSLLDENGRIVAQTGTLTPADTMFLAKVRQATEP